MADMENVHRHEKEEEEVAAEQPPPQPDFTDLSSYDEVHRHEEEEELSPPPRPEYSADRVRDVAIKSSVSESYDKIEVADTKIQSLSLSDNNLTAESKLVNEVVGDLKDELTVSDIGALKMEVEKTSKMDVKYENVRTEEIEEEEIELEIERAVHKLHTHTPHCPNCDYQITKIILRRRKVIIHRRHFLLVALHQYWSIFILFMLSGFRLITSFSFITRSKKGEDSGNRWNVFGFIRSQTYRLNMFSFSWETYRWNLSSFFSFGKSSSKVEHDQGSTTNNAQESTHHESETEGGSTNNVSPAEKSDKEKKRDDSNVKDGSERDNREKNSDHRLGEEGNNGGDELKKEDGPQVDIGPSADDNKAGDKAKKSKKKREKRKKDVRDEQNKEDESEADESEESDGEDERSRSQLFDFDFDFNRTKLVEILKCIVYGGLIESITSLSVVFSTVASDTTTLNVLAIGLAVLFSGLIAFTYNIIDLKNDAYSRKKYRKLLGSKNRFLFHATIAMLSYVVFGLVSPVTYSFAFRESDNKKYKIFAVAAAAFACISILSIAKAFVSGANSLRSYVKTTRFYVVMAVCLAGVGYAVGCMIEVLMLKLDWFKSAQRICLAPEVVVGGHAWGAY